MMENLPMEMVAEITQHLSVKEIIICCAVSREWRDIFGSDMVWKPFCGERTAEHLRNTPCRIEPKFESPAAKDTTLTPIGHWRMAYMRKVHLLKNWIQGNHICFEIDLEGQIQKYFFLTNDLLIICYISFIVLMNTSGTSPVGVARLELDKELFEDDYETIEVRSDLFVIQRNNIAQVIQVDLEAYNITVKHTFKIDDGFETTDALDYVAVGNVLLAVGGGIHVWDVDKALKLKLELCPNDCTCTFRGIICSKYCQDVIVLGFRSYVNYCFVYSVTELKYLQFRLSVDTYLTENNCAIVQNYIAVSFREAVQVYNYVNSQLLFTFPAARNFSVGALSTTFIFNHGDVVQSFHPQTGAIVKYRVYESPSTFLRLWLDNYEDRLLEESKLKYTIFVSIFIKLYGYSYSDDSLLLEFPYFSQLLKVAPTHSMAIVRKNFCESPLLYYFW